MIQEVTAATKRCKEEYILRCKESSLDLSIALFKEKVKVGDYIYRIRDTVHGKCGERYKVLDKGNKLLCVTDRRCHETICFYTDVDISDYFYGSKLWMSWLVDTI